MFLIEPLQEIDVPPALLGYSPGPTSKLALEEPNANAWGPFVVQGDGFRELGTALRVRETDNEEIAVAKVEYWNGSYMVLLFGNYPRREDDALVMHSMGRGVVTFRPILNEDADWITDDGSHDPRHAAAKQLGIAG